MILDKELEFADGTWAPTATGDNISPNVVDTGPLGGLPTANTGRDLGSGDKVTMLITVKTTVTSGGAATVDFRVRSSSESTLLASSPVDHGGTGPIALASLTAGAQFKVPLPGAASATTYKRYLGCNANIGTAVLTAGAFQVDIVKDVQGNTKYAAGFGIT